MRDRILAMSIWAMAAYGQSATTLTSGGHDAPYQVRYASNLLIGDSVVNMTNTGANATTGYPVQNGNLCANIYTYSPDEQLVSCCSCYVTPNALSSLSTRLDLISNTLTPLVPSSVVIKIVGSKATSPTTCNAALVGLPPNDLATGLAAWGTTIHAIPSAGGVPTGTYGVSETPFTPATLSSAELYRMTALCGFIQANGSGYGICKSCRIGGLGGSVK